MRTAFVIAISALFASNVVKAQQPPVAASDGFSCFANLGAPDYPKAALDAHVDGSIWTCTHLSKEGVPEKIDVDVVSSWSKGRELLDPAVEKAIRAAKFKPECDGKTVRAVFQYKFHGEATPQPKIETDDAGPNLMVISSEPNPVPRPARNTAFRR